MKNHFIVAAIIVLVILAAVLGAFFTKSNLNSNPSSSSDKIVLKSNSKDKQLVWKDKKILDDIVSKLEIFTKGMKEISNATTYPVNQIVITYFPEQINKFTDLDENDNIISGANYSVENGILSIEVYVNPNTAPNGNVNLAFSSKVIQMLVYLSNTEFRPLTNSQVQGVSETGRMGYFVDIMKGLHQEDGTVNIPVEIK